MQSMIQLTAGRLLKRVLVSRRKANLPTKIVFNLLEFPFIVTLEINFLIQNSCTFLYLSLFCSVYLILSLWYDFGKARTK
jgi:hypothetical protein